MLATATLKGTWPAYNANMELLLIIDLWKNKLRNRNKQRKENECCCGAQQFLSLLGFEKLWQDFYESPPENPANNAMQGPCGPCEGCAYGNRTDLAAGAVVAPHGLTARI